MLAPIQIQWSLCPSILPFARAGRNLALAARAIVLADPCLRSAPIYACGMGAWEPERSMIFTINENVFTIFVHAEDDCYAALWSCGICSAMDRSVGATA